MCVYKLIMAQPMMNFSMANPKKTEEIRSRLNDDVDCTSKHHPYHLKNMSQYTMKVNVSGIGSEIVRSIKKEVVDGQMAADLNQEKIINWAPRLQHLLEPLRTHGDGNCLMHAVSLAMWGTHDVYLFLRRLVFMSLINDIGGAFRKRWEVEHRLLNDTIPGLESMGFDQEWQLILSQSDVGSHDQTRAYEPLQGIHLFVLANVLRRPIIVVSEPFVKSASGEEIQRNVIAGIYLPLLWTGAQCPTKTPIVLAFHANHFAPLVIFDSDSESAGSQSESTDRAAAAEICYNALPLYDMRQEQFALRFATDDEKSNYSSYVAEYLTIHKVVYQHKRDSSNKKVFMAANLAGIELPHDLNVTDDFIASFKRSFNEGKMHTDDRMYSDVCMSECLKETCRNVTDKDTYPLCRDCASEMNVVPDRRVAKEVEFVGDANAGVGCVTKGCVNLGNAAVNGLCPECYIKNVQSSNVLSTVQDDTSENLEDDYVMLPEYKVGRNIFNDFKHHLNDLNNPKVLELNEVNINEPILGNKTDETQKIVKQPSLLCKNVTCSVEHCSNEVDPGIQICQSCLEKNLLKHRGKERDDKGGYEKAVNNVFWLPRKQNSVAKDAVRELGIAPRASRDSERNIPEPMQTVTSALICLSPFCDNATSNPNSLCASCLHVLADKDKAKKSGNSKKPRKCVRQNCEFFGSPEFGGLCSKCFKRSTPIAIPVTTEKKTNLPTPAPRDTVANRRGSPCRVVNCKRFGDVNMDGYCTKCFMDRSARMTNYQTPQPLYQQPAIPQLLNPHVVGGTAPLLYEYTPASGGYYLNIVPAAPRPTTDPTVCRRCEMKFAERLPNRMCDVCYTTVYGEDVVD